MQMIQVKVEDMILVLLWHNASLITSNLQISSNFMLEFLLKGGISCLRDGGLCITGDNSYCASSMANTPSLTEKEQ